MYKHTITTRVRYQETDKMAIVYHANYIIYFDMGRTEFMRSLGYEYDRIEGEGVWLPIIEVGCQYKSPAHYDEEITITTYIEEITRVKIRFKYEVKRGEELLVEGFTVQAFTTDKLKPIALNRANPELYNLLLGCTK